MLDWFLKKVGLRPEEKEEVVEEPPKEKL